MRRDTRDPRLLAGFAVAALMIFSAWGCGDSTDSGNDVSAIRGRVTGDTGYGFSAARQPAAVQGAEVTARQYTDDASLETVSRETVETDEDGKFILSTDLDDARFIVIVATTATEEWRGLVSGTLRLGETVSSPPINGETTLEASVHDRIFRNETADLVCYADIASAVDSDVSAAAPSAPSLRDWLVLGLEAFAGAEREILTGDSIGVPADALDRIWDRKIEAQAALESALHAAGDEASIRSALVAFDDAMISSYLDEGVGAADYAKSLIASLKALVKRLPSGDDAAQMAVAKRAGERRAQALERAMTEGFEVLGANAAELEDLLDAGETLRETIATSPSREGISAAFLTYHDEILDQLAVVREDEASLIRAIDQYVTFSSGLHGNFVDAVRVADPGDVAGLYLEYIREVRMFILDANTDLTEEELRALADVMTLSTLYD